MFFPSANRFVCLFLTFALRFLETSANKFECAADLWDDELRVYLTVSSLAQLTVWGEIRERHLELNWFNARPQPGDKVGLFTQDPTVNFTTPIESAEVRGKRGFYTSNSTFARPQFKADSLKSQCLGYWIAYLKDSRVIASSCLRSNPHWMWETRDNIEELYMQDILIPGAHDAGSYDRYWGLESEFMVPRVPMCQDENIWNQLIYGIRFFDFRIGYHNYSENKFWINHGPFRIHRLQPMLRDLLVFLNVTNEIVIIDFHSFETGFTNKSIHLLLIKNLEEMFGDYLLPRSQGPNITLSDIWKQKKRLIAFYNDQSYLQSEFLWPPLPQIWASFTIEPQRLKDFFYTAVTWPHDGVWSMMTELTASSPLWFKYPLISTRVYSDRINHNLTWWVYSDWWRRANVIATDYFHGNDVIECAIRANAKRKQCGLVQPRTKSNDE